MTRRSPVQRIGLADIAESPIDWDIAWPHGPLDFDLSPAEKKQPRPHQVDAIEAVLTGFAVGNDRGKLIMACGTGKTFTALKIAERTGGRCRRPLGAVPGAVDLAAVADAAGVDRAQRDRHAAVRGVLGHQSRRTRHRPAKTSPSTTCRFRPPPTRAKLADADGLDRRRANAMTVVFSTYQSIDVVAKAQNAGPDEFDLVICDEAHRTTGVTLAGDDESALRQDPRQRLHRRSQAALHDGHPAHLRRRGQGQGRRARGRAGVDGRRGRSSARSSTASASATPSRRPAHRLQGPRPDRR